MRRRRVAFHADSDEDYMAKVKSSDALESIPHLRIPPVSAYTTPNIMEELINNYANSTGQDGKAQLRARFIRNDELNNAPEKPTTHFECLDFAGQVSPGPELLSHPNNFRKSSDSEDLTYSINRDKALPSFSVKTIIFGDKRVRKDVFLDYLFGKGLDKGNGDIRSPLDLKIKTHEKGHEIVKYCLWIKDCGEKNVTDKLKSIYMVYYRTVPAFVFLYSVEDRDSFICLNNTVKELVNDIGPTKFKGVLIGLKDDKIKTQEFSGNRKVSIEEAEDLKQTAGLQAFLEVDLNESFQKEAIFSLLEDFKKSAPRCNC